MNTSAVSEPAPEPFLPRSFATTRSALDSFSFLKALSASAEVGGSGNLPMVATPMNLPPELDELVMACLEKDPNRRPRDAEVLFQLACGCHDCETWGQPAAKEWWENHLPQFTGSLTLGESAVIPSPQEVAAL